MPPFGLPAFSGLLLALSFPPFDTLVLPFLALVPVGVWVARLSGGAPGARASVRGGALLGAVYFGLVLHWVPLALVVADPGLGSAAFAVAAFGLIVVGLSGLTAASVRLLHHAVHRFAAPLWLALAVTWTALEWVRAHLPDSLALPWLGLGTSLTEYPEVVGIAEIVGARGVTFWLAAVSGLLATIWLRRTADETDSSRRTATVAAVTAIVVGAPVAWGVWRASALEIRPLADVAVVQPNAAGRAKVPPEPAPPRDPTELLPSLAGSLDLVVLPELFLRAVPGSPEASGAVETLRAYSRDVGAPVLFGALGATAKRDASEDPDDGLVLHNSAFLVTPDGLADFRYDKHRLVPLVERIPFTPRGVGGRGRGGGAVGAGGYGVGEGWPLAEVDGVRYGVLICYESSYPEAARALRRAGADVLVNITNDAWFGAEPWYARTTALWQHPAHLVMRAIEGRVGVVRAANTGISFFVDPVGRKHEVTRLFTSDRRSYGVRSTELTTVYVRFGDVVGTVCALVAFGLALLTWAPSLDPSRSRV